MIRAAKDGWPEIGENAPGWLRRLMAMPATKRSVSLGMFNLSIEGIIRVCLDKDASQAVEFDTETLSRCLRHLSEDGINPDLKSWALAVTTPSAIPITVLSKPNIEVK